MSSKDVLFEIEISNERIEKIAKRFIKDVLDLVDEISEKLGLTYEAQRILVDELFMNIIGQILIYVVQTNYKTTIEYHSFLEKLSFKT